MAVDLEYIGIIFGVRYKWKVDNMTRSKIQSKSQRKNSI